MPHSERAYILNAGVVASWRRGDGAREPAVQREGAVIRRLYYEQRPLPAAIVSMLTNA
jgi:hypothetical protein